MSKNPKSRGCPLDYRTLLYTTGPTSDATSCSSPSSGDINYRAAGLQASRIQHDDKSNRCSNKVCEGALLTDGFGEPSSAHISHGMAFFLAYQGIYALHFSINLRHHWQLPAFLDSVELADARRNTHKHPGLPVPAAPHMHYRSRANQVLHPCVTADSFLGAPRQAF